MSIFNFYCILLNLVEYAYLFDNILKKYFYNDILLMRVKSVKR